ncbi:unnamed protein product [Rotaria sp. Silwood2]|nr:unnamed protein product [Rotaria sp. Silwood2]
MIKEWKRDIETRRDQTRSYLISGEDTLEVRDDDVQVEVVTSEIPTSPFKAQIAVVPPVTASIAVSFPTKSDVIKKFTLNDQQKFAFMIVTSHLDGDNQFHTEEAESAANEVVPACLPTSNPAFYEFPQMFRKDIVLLVETCYKYSKGKSNGSKTCRMRMPRMLVKTSNIDPSTGQITMRRSHPWINNCNEWTISACRSNMDIKFIWTGNDAKALVYYITD